MAGTTLTWIHDHDALPPTRQALGPGSEAPGLLAAGGRVTPQRLEEAYQRGIFPWFSPGDPPLWWAPDPRMVLPVAEFKLAQSLRKTLRRFIRTPGCEVRIDSAFRNVMQACASTPRDGQAGTWIVPEMVDSYTRWHHLGRVHSFEAWRYGQLIGGLYGVGMGRMFFGESMFTRETDGSKIALAALIAFAREHDIGLIDCQQRTAHLASFGGRELPRSEFEARLQALTSRPEITDWTYHPRLWAHVLGSGREQAQPQDDRA